MFRLDETGMERIAHRFDFRSVFRPVGLLLLISLLVFQFMAPSVSASPALERAHIHQADTRPSDCGMLAAKAMRLADGSEKQGGHHENAAHCTPSMCCFHDTHESLTLVAIGKLLPGRRLIERGLALSSHLAPARDRPPRQV